VTTTPAVFVSVSSTGIVVAVPVGGFVVPSAIATLATLMMSGEGVGVGVATAGDAVACGALEAGPVGVMDGLIGAEPPLLPHPVAERAARKEKAANPLLGRRRTRGFLR
jgi:hypothetical protein